MLQYGGRGAYDDGLRCALRASQILEALKRMQHGTYARRPHACACRVHVYICVSVCYYDIARQGSEKEIPTASLPHWLD